MSETTTTAPASRPAPRNRGEYRAGCYVIRTNNKPRPIFSGFDLTKKERAEFDWMTPEEIEIAQFFRARGAVYALSEFCRIVKPGRAVHPMDCADVNLQGWTGYKADSMSTGNLVRISDDCEILVFASFRIVSE